jgi:biotin carboxylase
MPTALVLLPSTTYRATDFIRAAEGLGVDLIVASDQPPPFDMADGYLAVDCSDPRSAADEIVRLGDRTAIDAIVAADDAGVVVAALAGTKLGLRANDPAAAEASRDKYRQRLLMAGAEVPQPSFALLDDDADTARVGEDVGYPLVVKPLDRTASQGVLRVDNPSALQEVVDRARRIVGGHAPLLLERFMPGDEVALEGIVVEGELVELAIFDKPDAPVGPAFPETILVTPSRLGLTSQEECRRVAAKAVAAVGITHGPVHVEMKVEGTEVRVIELAARSIGGLCSHSLNFGLMGTSLETLILRNALGLDKTELRREPVASGVLMIPVPRPGRLVEVRGLDEVRQLPGISAIDITTRPGAELLPTPEGDRYLGFVFARAKHPDEVDRVLREAMRLIEVVIE